LRTRKTETISKHHQLDAQTAVRTVREIIEYPGARFLSEEYPMLREIPQTNAAKPPNVVIIVLEGWTGKFVKPITDGLVDGREVTPHFNKLATEGLFFSRMFASGGRTTNGLLALIGGIPDRPGLTAVRTPQIMNRFSGLPSVLAGMGYSTFFISGNDLNFNNKGTIMKHWGSAELTGKKQIDALKRFEIGAWGYYDRDVFTLLHEKMMEGHRTGRPVNGIVHTITTHYPYKTPDKKFDAFGKETRDHEYINVLHYADWALHDYLEEARKAPYFKDTVFFLISDHSHHRFLNYYEDRNVPFLI
jgi:phosphoglycerol transferase MdoB-like AlkP superfamily enzyme